MRTMRAAPSLGSRVRAGALLALGALGVHQLRYLLVTGDVSVTGHTYLELLAPLLVGTAIAAIGLSFAAAALRRRLPKPLDPGCATERAAAYAVGLLAVYLAQELTEGLLVAGHGGAAEILTGAGGWLAVPLAMAFGAFAALAGVWLDRVEASLVPAADRPKLRAPRRLRSRTSPELPALAARPLAFGLARRPPPAPPSFAA